MRGNATRALVLVGTLTFTAAANAQSSPEPAPPPPAAPAAGESGTTLEEARIHYERAIELYNEDAYDAALVEIRRAYDLSPNYKMLFNMGHIQRARKDFASALSAFERYLAQGKASITAARRAEIEREISVLKTRVATVEIVCPVPQATIAIDDITVGTTPLKTPLIVNPGRRKIVASKPGYAPATVWVELAGTDAERVEVVPTSIATARSDAAPVREGSKVPMIVAWSATGALAIATGVFGAIALKKSDDLTNETNRFNASATPAQAAQNLDDAKSSMRTFSITTDILAGLTLIGAGTALYLTLTRPTAEKAQTARADSVGLKLGLGRLDLSGTF